MARKQEQEQNFIDVISTMSHGRRNHLLYTLGYDYALIKLVVRWHHCKETQANGVLAFLNTSTFRVNSWYIFGYQPLIIADSSRGSFSCNGNIRSPSQRPTLAKQIRQTAHGDAERLKPQTKLFGVLH